MASQEPAPESVIFVCWGNICRSPMAERVAQHQAAAYGLDDVRFASAGVSSEEIGSPVDPRAAEVLRRHGYSADGHRAHQIGSAELASAGWVIAMVQQHIDLLRRLGDTAHVRLLTDFDPDATAGAGIRDPWSGSPDGFEDTLASVEAAIPGVLTAVAEHRRAGSGETP